MRDAVRRLRDHDEEGLSLVEIMVAAFVLSVGLLALASVAISSLISLSTSQGRQEATDAASALIEDLRRSNYAAVALDASDPDVVALGTCDATYGERLVTSNRDDALPHVRTFGPSGRITLTTTISWYDESGACVGGDRDVKRVRVLASWENRGRTFTLEESTLVAPVDRGLPAPDFRLGPPESEIDFHVNDLATGLEKCLPHSLRNLGATDGYEWAIDRVGGGPRVKANEATYSLANGDWHIRAFLEFPPQDPPLDPADEKVPANQIVRHDNMAEELELLVDGNNNLWPDTETRLETGDQGRLWICYRPGKSADNYTVGSSLTFNVTVRSQFDPNRFEVVQHRLRVVNQMITWYLFDEFIPEPGEEPTAAEASHPRVRAVQGNQLGIPILTMGPDVGVEPQTLRTLPGLPNYDTDFTDLAGMRLKDGQRLDKPSDPQWPASRVTFHGQVRADTTFRPQLMLRLWSAPEAALRGTLNGATPTLHYNVRLEVLSRNEGALNPRLIVFDQDLAAPQHTTDGWQLWEQLVTLPGGDLFMAKDRYLRLEITCLDASDDTCHIAFDHQDVPSHLQLQVKS